MLQLSLIPHIKGASRSRRWGFGSGGGWHAVTCATEPFAHRNSRKGQANNTNHSKYSINRTIHPPSSLAIFLHHRSSFPFSPLYSLFLLRASRRQQHYIVRSLWRFLCALLLILLMLGVRLNERILACVYLWEMHTRENTALIVGLEGNQPTNDGLLSLNWLLVFWNIFR